MKPLVIPALFLLAGLSAGAYAQSFYGYPCTGNCSGHEAGYDWAERNDVDDPDDCGGNSNSFIEGCQAYAEEQQADEENDDYDEYDDEDDY